MVGTEGTCVLVSRRECVADARAGSVTRRPALVIGAGGLVGRHVLGALAPSSVGTFHQAVPPDGIALDITDTPEVRRVVDDVRPDVIVLAAAEASVERCEREPVVTRRVNVDATRSVAEVARATGACFVVFSSEYVFDGREGPYAEDASTSPLNDYGRQKVELEMIARGVPRHLVCRVSGVFGWEDAKKNFVCQLLDRLRTGRPFAVPNDQVITPTHAPDLGQAIRLLLSGGHVGTFHVVGPEILPRDEFGRRVARAFELEPALIRPRRTAELGLAARRPERAGLLDTKLASTIGRLPTLADALARMRAGEASI